MYLRQAHGNLSYRTVNSHTYLYKSPDMELNNAMVYLLAGPVCYESSHSALSMLTPEA